jgi:Ca-activated chloride channel family protein
VPEITFTGTYDTAFYAHYFLTGDREKDAEVKCTYAQAHTRDPLTQQEDCWVSVSYNSKYDGVGMKTNTGGRSSNRPALNLVVALDISGSMGDTFRGDDSDEDETSAVGGQKKLQVAKECLLTLLAQLRDDDAFGLVLFNTQASILQPLTKWGEIERVGLEKAILKLRANGGTELTEGIHQCLLPICHQPVDSTGHLLRRVQGRHQDVRKGRGGPQQVQPHLLPDGYRTP